jgi:hypothetical protein
MTAARVDDADQSRHNSSVFIPENILVIGSSNTDMIIRVPHIPKPGETVLGGGFTMAAGGAACDEVRCPTLGPNPTRDRGVSRGEFTETLKKSPHH